MNGPGGDYAHVLDESGLGASERSIFGNKL
jgi:hypothetical protein